MKSQAFTKIYWVLFIHKEAWWALESTKMKKRSRRSAGNLQFDM
jgi:hypothetical protein